MTRGAHVKRRPRWRSATTGLVATFVTLSIVVPQVHTATAGSVTGSAGTDTALPPTDSAVKASGRGTFAGVNITVNQTKNLVHQAVSVTWSGAPLPVVASGGSEVDGNFMQIFQCWGDDDGTNTGNPGPAPENCEFGGWDANQRASLPVPSHYFRSRVISQVGWSTYTTDPKVGYADTTTGLLWKPFKAVDGKVVPLQANLGASDIFSVGLGGFWLNNYFNYFNTNEDVFAPTHGDGTGSELVTVDTGLEAPGLGCGQKVQVQVDGSKTTPKCWLVVVPRGTPAQENPPEFGPANPVLTSPLSPTAWQNRIAIPLQFNPVDSPCAIGADERRIVGSELAAPAVTNWQPTLCSEPGSPPYNYAAISDDLARRQLVSQTGAPGMAVVSRPFDPASLDPNNPIVYAPLTLSGVTIGFNFERVAARDPNTGLPKDPSELQLAGIRVAHMNLTPRLMAKLLTESYRHQFYQLAIGGKVPSGYDWYLKNPADLAADPDFAQFNSEFQYLQGGSNAAAYLVVEQPTGDAAYELWRWILADPEAKAWLAGTPDPWGMVVNPVYSTDPRLNPSRIGFASSIPNSYPKSDSFCYHDTNPQDDVPQGSGHFPRPLCMLDVAPYANSMGVAALEARNADDGAKTTLDVFKDSADNAWVANGPQRSGVRAMLAVTDSASAARYGLQAASLSRAGDDGSSRTFVAPFDPAATDPATQYAGLMAAAKAMPPSSVAGVLEPEPATTPAGAYPLTMLTYAAATPNSLDAASRKDYAAFVNYAAGAGQTPGIQFGQLPPGYAPLPTDLRAQAVAASSLILNGVPTTAPAAAAGTAASPNPASPAATPDSTPSTTQPAQAQASAGAAGGSVTAAPPGAIGQASEAPLAATAAPGPGSTVKITALGSTSRTPNDVLGAIRYALPLALGMGIAAAAAAEILSRRRRKLARSI